jgi:hypothetical protein
VKFFPPSQLPPMRGHEELPEFEPPCPKQPTLRRRIVCVLVSALVGVGVAALGFHLSSSPVWFAALPVALAFGWYIGSNPTEPLQASTRGPGGSGPVLW